MKEPRRTPLDHSIRQFGLRRQYRPGCTTGLALILATGATLVLNGQAHAQNITWTRGAATEAWGTPGNWSTGLVPDVASVVLINAVPVTVLSTTTAVNSTTISGTGELQIKGAGSQLTSGVTIAGGTLQVGGVGGGALIGSVNISAGNLGVQGLGTLTGNVTLSGGTASIAGTIVGNVDVVGGLFVANAGGFSLSGLATVSGGELRNSGGALNGGVNVLSGGTFNNNTGTAGAVSSAGTSLNAGSIASLAVTGGTFTNRSSVTGATTVSGGVLTLETSSNLSDTHGLNVSGGTVHLNASDTVSAVTLSSGSITGTGTLTSTSNFIMQSGTVSALLGGTVGLDKTGAGTVTLSGANTYTGDTTVKAGTLTVSSTGRINSGSMSVGEASGDDGSLIIANGGAVSSSTGRIGVSSGIGRGTITGAGSAWNVSSNLFVGSGGTGTLTIEDGGTLNSSAVAYIGSSGGTGTVTVTGTNSTWNANSAISVGLASGGSTSTLTIADGGTIRSNGSSVTIGNAVASTATVTGAGSTWTDIGLLELGFSNTGALTIKDGGVVSAANARIGGNGSGIGTVTVSGADSTLTTAGDLYVGYFGTGTLNIGNYDLSTPDVAGTVTANRLISDLGGSGTVNFNQTDATTFATPIQGNIAVNQRGTGTTTLTGANTYSGGTTVSGGKLAVNGSLTYSTVTVNSGGTLGGSGSIAGAVAVNSGGTLAPGNSPGLLTVGSLTLNAGSTTVMEIDGTTRGTQYDAIDVTGAAMLDGTLNLVFGYTPTVGDSYTLIDAGAISGNFSSIATSGLGAALKVVPTITDDYVMTLDFSQESFVTAAGGAGALTGNQSGVAANLDTFSTSGQAADLIAALNTLSAGALPPAFDQLSGTSHAFVPTLAFNAVRQFHHLLGQRSGGINDMGGASAAFNALMGAKLAYAGDDLASLVAGGEVAQDGFWVRALAADGRIDGDGNAAGADTSGAGLALGADRRIDANRLAGVAVAYGTSRADAGGGTLDVTSFQLAAYGRWQGEQYYLDGSLGFGRHRTESRRDIAFLNQRARADYDADSLSLNLEAGRPIAGGPATLTPYAGIEGTLLRRAGFAETGSAANLSVQGRTEGGWRSRLGARYQWNGARFQPTLDLAWVHAFGDAATRVDARFAAVPAAPTFRVAGPELDRDRLALGLGLTAWAGKNARLDLAYNGEFANSDREQNVAATFRWVW